MPALVVSMALAIRCYIERCSTKTKLGYASGMSYRETDRVSLQARSWGTLGGMSTEPRHRVRLVERSSMEYTDFLQLIISNPTPCLKNAKNLPLIVFFPC